MIRSTGLVADAPCGHVSASSPSRSAAARTAWPARTRSAGTTCSRAGRSGPRRRWRWSSAAGCVRASRRTRRSSPPSGLRPGRRRRLGGPARTRRSGPGPAGSPAAAAQRRVAFTPSRTAIAQTPFRIAACASRSPSATPARHATSVATTGTSAVGAAGPGAALPLQPADQPAHPRRGLPPAVLHCCTRSCSCSSWNHVFPLSRGVLNRCLGRCWLLSAWQVGHSPEPCAELALRPVSRPG